MKTKYSKIELLFSNKWKWVRRLSKQLWIKPNGKGYLWVKFTKDELLFYKEKLGIDLEKAPDCLIEDWRS